MEADTAWLGRFQAKLTSVQWCMELRKDVAEKAGRRVLSRRMRATGRARGGSIALGDPVREGFTQAIISGLEKIMKHSRLMGSTLVVIAASTAAHADPNLRVPVHLDIASQPVEGALYAWAAQTGYQLLMVADQVDGGRPVQPIAGQYAPEAALKALLSATDLRYQLVNAHTVAIHLASSDHGNDLPAFRALEEGGSSGAGPSSTAAGARNDGAAPLEEVVVTAQKREERLQDVPISISVLGGDQLDRSPVSGVTEALNLVPGIVAEKGAQGGGTQISMRGVGASGPLFNGSSPIAYYLDSVPFGLVKTAVAPDSNAYDLARIEALRGPQGTLYGASAQNGVVRILTHDPDLNEFELKARSSFSKTSGGGDNYRGDAAVNVPIVEGKLAARAVVGYENIGGWIDSPVRRDINDAELRNSRLKIGAQPTDEFSAQLSAWSSRSDYGAPSKSLRDGSISASNPESISTDYDAYGLTLKYDAAQFSVSSMTSYLDYQNEGRVDLAFFALPVLFTGLDARVFSQEVLLSSSTGSAWRWSVGGFYRDASDRLRQNNLGGGLPFDYGNSSKSEAVFGEVGRRFFNNALEWTLGARYFHDDVGVRENVNQTPGLPIYDRKDKFHSTTPRAVLSWYPSESMTLYTSYSEGFRSGFPQDPGVGKTYPDFPPLKPDKLRNYEVGAKASALDGRISFDAAVYYIDWKDVQQTLVVPVNGTFVTALINGQSASGVGVDFGIAARPISGLDLGLSFSWNDLSLDSVVLSSGQPLFNKGDRLNYSSKYTAGASVGYSHPLGASGLTGQFSASANYASKQVQHGDLGGFLYTTSGDDRLFARASVGVAGAAERWSASLFIDNATNERGATPAVLPIPDWSTRAQPRTVGLQANVRF